MCFSANAPESDRRDLLSELELMKKLKPHPHVIKLMGCVTETGKGNADNLNEYCNDSIERSPCNMCPLSQSNRRFPLNAVFVISTSKFPTTKMTLILTLYIQIYMF